MTLTSEHVCLRSGGTLRRTCARCPGKTLLSWPGQSLASLRAPRTIKCPLRYLLRSSSTGTLFPGRLHPLEQNHVCTFKHTTVTTQHVGGRVWHRGTRHGRLAPLHSFAVAVPTSASLAGARPNTGRVRVLEAASAPAPSTSSSSSSSCSSSSSSGIRILVSIQSRMISRMRRQHDPSAVLGVDPHSPPQPVAHSSSSCHLHLRNPQTKPPSVIRVPVHCYNNLASRLAAHLLPCQPFQSQPSGRPQCQPYC